MSAMCGRFAFGARLEHALLDLNMMTDLDPAPRWNIAPTDVHPVLTMDEERWIWALDDGGLRRAKSREKHPSMRALETAAKPVFRQSMRTARMAVPATGWYEWWLHRLDAVLPPRAPIWGDHVAGGVLHPEDWRASRC